MNFFNEMRNDKPYVKMALEGFAGSGKTYTAALCAIGIASLIKSKKPIAFFDTEKASRALMSLFESQNTKAVVKRSRSLADLEQAFQVCEDGASDILIIDSITHVWEGFIQGYLKDKRKSRLTFPDWGFIKPTWKERFSNRLVNSNLHVIFTGRAGFEYEDVIENGKKAIVKSGIKMRSSNEDAYEPDILLLMERMEDVVGKKKKVWREGTIIKDRTNTIDGKTFKNPGFKELSPFINKMLDGSLEEDGVDTPNDYTITEDEGNERSRARKIMIEEITNSLVSLGLSTSAPEKKAKIDILDRLFGTKSWTAVEGLDAGVLRIGLDRLTTLCASWGEYVLSQKQEGLKPEIGHIYDMVDVACNDFDSLMGSK